MHIATEGPGGVASVRLRQPMKGTMSGTVGGFINRGPQPAKNTDRINVVRRGAQDIGLGLPLPGLRKRLEEGHPGRTQAAICQQPQRQPR